MAQQHRLDLPRLNAKAAQLHLPIRAPEKVQTPLRTPARQVPAAVHPAPRSSKRVRHKPLRREPRAIQIPPRKPRSRDVQFPRYPRRHRLQSAVQHVNPRVPDRPTNRRNRQAGQGFAHARADRHLRRAIGVDHSPALRPARDHIRRACLAGDNQGLERHVIRQVGQQPRRQGRMADVLLAHQACESMTAAFPCRHDEGRTR